MGLIPAQKYFSKDEFEDHQKVLFLVRSISSGNRQTDAGNQRIEEKGEEIPS